MSNLARPLSRLSRARGSLAALLSVSISACASGGTEAPEGVRPAAANSPLETPASDTRPAERSTAAQPATPPGRRLVYGVDLDTIEAGPFDQGKMWTFEYPPVEYFAETYGLRPDDAWFEKARLGALRIPNCSASFVSSHGLVLTNHHCARSFVSGISGPGEALLDDGFVATDLVDERPVEDFEADRLIRIVDVTDEVNGALDPIPPEERPAAREALLGEIEERIRTEHGGEQGGHVVEMVSLYNGGKTSAYVFRRYTNARLVMAPELQIGFFGGDEDNFTYPRYNLDFAFFRLYDDSGAPLRSEPYFAVDRDGVEAGDVVFIVGNPGSTSRLQTVAQLEFRRDVGDRSIIELLESRMVALDDFIRLNSEVAEERDLRNTYFSLANSLKAFRGQLRGLEDPVILARRADAERDFQAAIEADPDLEDRFGTLIDEMAALQERKRERAPGFGAFLAMTSPDMASATLHRALLAFQILSARQRGAPSEQTEALFEQLKAVPNQPPALDRALMEARFHDFVDLYGEASDLASAVLGGSTVEVRARQVASASQLRDSASAVEAMESGAVGLEDPAIGVVRAYLPTFIAFQQLAGSVFPEEERVAAELGRARLEVYGTDVPPDATFSLRLADGVVRGYEYNGTVAPPFTTLFGLYDRHFAHGGVGSWALPERWIAARSDLTLSTPMNFVSTADIIGGNSGSPVLDADLELVGVVFDGNIESLPGDYVYLPERNRSVTVDIRAIIEALDEIYEMDRLVAELVTGRLFETERDADAEAR